MLMHEFTEVVKLTRYTCDSNIFRLRLLINFKCTILFTISIQGKMVAIRYRLLGGYAKTSTTLKIFSRTILGKTRIRLYKRISQGASVIDTQP